MEMKFNEIPYDFTLTNNSDRVKQIQIFKSDLTYNIKPGDAIKLRAEGSDAALFYYGFLATGLDVTWTEGIIGSCATPTVIETTNEDGTKNITLHCITKQAKIYWTADDAVTDAKIVEQGTLYIPNEVLTVSENATLRAVAVEANHENSTVLTKEYTFTVATPTASIAAGNVSKGTQVSLSCATSGAGLYITLDGTTPTSESIAYEGPISIDTNMTVKAIAVKNGWTASEVLSLNFVVKMPTPTASIESGTVEANTQVSLSCSENEATIYYTLDGSMPVVEGEISNDALTYEEPLTITASTTIKAVAFMEDCTPSDVATFEYVVTSGQE